MRALVLLLTAFGAYSFHTPVRVPAQRLASVLKLSAEGSKGPQGEGFWVNDDDSSSTKAGAKASAGERELDALRQARKAKEDERAEKIDQFVMENLELKQNPRAGTVPEAVSKRMLGRMVPLFSVPFVLGIGTFVGLYLYGAKTGTIMQPGVVAYVTWAPFLAGLLGLSYGVLSASWDEEVEGSFLGFEEFSTNVGRILEGLQRSSERRELEEAIAERERELKQKAKAKVQNARDAANDKESKGFSS